MGQVKHYVNTNADKLDNSWFHQTIPGRSKKNNHKSVGELSYCRRLGSAGTNGIRSKTRAKSFVEEAFSMHEKK